MFPRRLTRYVIAELLKVFLMTLAAVTLFMIVVVVAREALRHGLGLGPLLRLIPYVLPEALLLAVPATTLLAVCSIFGRMSADNELLAIKSMGISPSVFVRPSLVLGFFISLATVWLNDVAFSWGEPGMKRVIVESVEEIAYRMLRARGSFSRPHFSIHVAGVEGRRLIRPTLVFNASNSSPETILTAREAELKRNPEENTLSILLTDGMAERGHDIFFAFDGQEEGIVPLLDDPSSMATARSPSHLPFHQIPREIENQQDTLDARRRALATLAACQMWSGQFDELAGGEWRVHAERMTKDQHRLKHLQAVPWRRWATGFSCLCFAMVGVPLAIHIRSANLFTTFAACFLPILLVYYPLLVYGVDRTKCGALPPYAVWLGNVICGGVGLILLRRVLRR
jgi:lipopolysaccharide export system permease protein